MALEIEGKPRGPMGELIDLASEAYICHLLITLHNSTTMQQATSHKQSVSHQQTTVYQSTKRSLAPSPTPPKRLHIDDPQLQADIQEIDAWVLEAKNSATALVEAHTAYKKAKILAANAAQRCHQAMQENQYYTVLSAKLSSFIMYNGYHTHVPARLTPLNCKANNEKAMCAHCGYEGALFFTADVNLTNRYFLMPVCRKDATHAMHFQCLYNFATTHQDRRCPLCDDDAFDSLYLHKDNTNMYRNMWHSWAATTGVDLPVKTYSNGINTPALVESVKTRFTNSTPEDLRFPEGNKKMHTKTLNAIGQLATMLQKGANSNEPIALA